VRDNIPLPTSPVEGMNVKSSLLLALVVVDWSFQEKATVVAQSDAQQNVSRPARGSELVYYLPVRRKFHVRIAEWRLPSDPVS
jgi:hypothetical protein